MWVNGHQGGSGRHLVRHGGGPHFSSDGTLPKVAKANVGPQVPVEVQQDVVIARDRVKELGYVVMRLDLQQCSILSPDMGVKVCCESPAG